MSTVALDLFEKNYLGRAVSLTSLLSIQNRKGDNSVQCWYNSNKIYHGPVLIYFETSKQTSLFWSAKFPSFSYISDSSACKSSIVFYKEITFHFGNSTIQISISSLTRTRLLIHLFPMNFFSTPLKMQKTLRFSDAFRGVEKRCIGNNCVNKAFLCINIFRVTGLSLYWSTG